MDPRQAWSFAEQASEEPIEVQDYYEGIRMEWLTEAMAEEEERAESCGGP